MNRYQTFVPRFLALLLDSIILLPLVILTDLFAGDEFPESWRPFALAAVNLVNILYFVILHARWGQTAGKYLMKVKVVRVLDETGIGYGRSILRELPQLILVSLSLIPTLNVTIGGPPEAPITPVYLLVMIWGFADVIVFALNDKRRALHDFIAGTIVIRVDRDNKLLS